MHPLDPERIFMKAWPMIAKTYTCSLLGIDAVLAEVEVDLASGLPGFSTVGLPDNMVKESKDRVKAAIRNSGYPFPFEKITVNLVPAALKKEGAGFDLPIAIGILSAPGIVNGKKAESVMLVGELALDGRVEPVPGCLPIAVKARDSCFRDLIVPGENAPGAAVVDSVSVHPVDHPAQVVEFLNGRAGLPARKTDHCIFRLMSGTTVKKEKTRSANFSRRGSCGCLNAGAMSRPADKRASISTERKEGNSCITSSKKAILFDRMAEINQAHRRRNQSFLKGQEKLPSYLAGPGRTEPRPIPSSVPIWLNPGSQAFP